MPPPAQGVAPCPIPELQAAPRSRIIVPAVAAVAPDRRIAAFLEDSGMNFVALRTVFVAVIGLALAGSPLLPGPARGAEPAAASNLRTQIEALAASNGIRLLGALRIEQSAARKTSGGLGQSLRDLLTDYNFAMVKDRDGAIRTISVSGRKRPAPDTTIRISIKTTRRGANHYLDAVIMGRRPVRTHVQFLIDTGASMVVLPISMARTLGYDDDDLTKITLQTANGEVLGRTATLRSVEVGRAVARNIAVAFVDDERLGRNRLLGMSFLSRFVVTIDDAANVMSLVQTPE